MPTSQTDNINKYKRLTKEVGFVLSAQDYLIYLEGLPSARVNDIIISPTGGRALVTTLAKDKIEALMLDKERPFPGTAFSINKNGLSIPLSDNLLGRTFNPLGEPLDGKEPFPPGGAPLELDVVAGGIHTREIIDEQLITGLSKIDILLPIGRGQRELLFGEPKSGKGAFLRDIIVNQKDKGIICIYTSIGQSEIITKQFVQNIEEAGASFYTIVIAATSRESAPLISIAPSVAMSVAEYFRDTGRNVLVILDDLGLHAKYLREIGLLSGRIPGRESYPADIFYQHSHLVERAGKYRRETGINSITLIPVIETDIENFTNLIPTNVMSMTDGHLFFSSSLRAQGHYPALEVGRSVTRVGHQTQKPILKELADKVRRLLADYTELERYGRFGSELSSETQIIIKRGIVAQELLDQERNEKIDLNAQILLLSLVFTSFFDLKDAEFVKKNKTKIIKVLEENTSFNRILTTGTEMDFAELLKLLSVKLKIMEEACR